jgi:hypothetical protein
VIRSQEEQGFLMFSGLATGSGGIDNLESRATVVSAGAQCCLNDADLWSNAGDTISEGLAIV